MNKIIFSEINITSRRFSYEMYHKIVRTSLYPDVSKQDYFALRMCHNVSVYYFVSVIPVAGHIELWSKVLVK